MKRLLYNTLGVFLLFCTVHAHAQIITTYAGDTTAGYGGDGFAATNAQMQQPYGVATDYAGNLYIVDEPANCVRKVSAAGIITTIAGTGTAGYNGDNIPATAAQLNNPISVAADRFGNVYIADWQNVRIRKVDTAGTITTVVNGIVPQTVAVSYAGTLYFSAGSYIYQLLGGTPSVVAGPSSVTGSGSIVTPNGLAFDGTGNLYIANTAGSGMQVFKMTPSGAFSLVAGDGLTCGIGCPTGAPATSIAIYSGMGIAVNKEGDLFLSTAGDERILKIDTSGILTTYAGTCDYFGHSGDGGPALSAEIAPGMMGNAYNGLAVDTLGDLYLAEPVFHAVRKISNPLVSLHSPAVPIVTRETLSVIPTPCNGSFDILVTSAVDEQIAIVITDMLGRRVATLTAQTNKPLHTNLRLTPGIYSASAVTGERAVMARVIIR